MLIWVTDNSTCHIWRSGLNQKLIVSLLGAVPKGVLQDPGAVNKPVLCGSCSQQHPHLLGGAAGESTMVPPGCGAGALSYPLVPPAVWSCRTCLKSTQECGFLFSTFFWLILKPSWLALPALGFTSV